MDAEEWVGVVVSRGYGAEEAIEEVRGDRAVVYFF
jgi:hypothetical protein